MATESNAYAPLPSSPPFGGSAENRRRTLLAIGPVPPPVNGMSKAFELLVRNLPSHGWDVRVVDSADRSPPRVASAFSLARAARIVRVLARACLDIRHADAVYVTIAQSRWGFAKDVVVLNASAAMGRPVIAHMHGGNFSGFYRSLTAVERRIVRSTLDRVSRIVVLAEGLKEDFSMTRDWPRRTVAISNACDVPLGTVRRLRPGTLHVLYLSNLVVSKGYRDVVQAVGALATHRPELRVRLDLAGALAPGGEFVDGGAQTTELERLFAALPRSVTATYHGPVTGTRKHDLLAGADVFVLPTWYRNEGQPIAILEALTSGLPVVATDWRGIRESLPREMWASLVPPRAPDAIASRLQDLVEHPDEFTALSRAALAKAASFTEDRHVASVDSVLRTALPGEAA
jgi:glycosyltransferase involved in cell wall biosynthesis